jgi:hypothetical protein
MNLYEQIIAIEPELKGQIIIAVKQINPNASFINECLIEETWDTSLGIPLPTAQEVVTAWSNLKIIQAQKSDARKQYEQLIASGFTSFPLPSLQGKSLRLKVTTESAIMVNLRVSQLREAITQGFVNQDTDFTKVWDYDGKSTQLSVKDFFSIVIPFSMIVERVLDLERQL